MTGNYNFETASMTSILEQLGAGVSSQEMQRYSTAQVVFHNPPPPGVEWIRVGRIKFLYPMVVSPGPVDPVFPR